MMDPQREQRRQIRDEIAGRRSPTGGHPAPEPGPSRQQTRRPESLVRPDAKPDENPFPDYIPLPPDFKEAPLA